MKTRLTLLAMALFTLTVFSARADETITVTATNDDISSSLDLKAVATLFGEVETLEEFEQKLNDGENRISNLDLNADGYVDYLRVLESVENNVHAIIIQAILAKDIYQDVATIYVEKENEEVSVQVIGDEYIYGANYIIEPVYIIRPHLYDWFWGPSWTCWYSHWYWDYYPSYWYPYTCWITTAYWRHIHTWHYHHAYCSYRYPHAPRPHFVGYDRIYSRHDYALAHPQNAFVNRNTGATNARDLQANRSTRDINSTRGINTVGGSAAGNADRTYGSSNVRAAGSTRVNSSSTAARTNATGSSRTVSSTSAAASTRNSSSSRVASTTTRTGSETSTRTGSSNTGRSASVTTTTRSTTPSTRSASTTVSRATTPTTTRSATSTTGRSSSSYSGSSSRSSSSYSGSSSHSSGSYSGSSSRSGGSTRR